jgi:MFS superfamily sulfate permease-like transporter
MFELLGLLLILVLIVAFVYIIGTGLGVLLGIVLSPFFIIGKTLEERAKNRLWKMHKEGKLPRPWEFYEKEREVTGKLWLNIEQDVLKELRDQEKTDGKEETK